MGDHVFLKVMPKRGVVRFGKWGKLSPRYIRPFEYSRGWAQLRISWRYRRAYQGVQEVFHVSILRKYTPDPTHVVDWGEHVIDADGTFEVGPVCILDSRD